MQDLYDHILDEVTRTGFLYKKGHSMLKSIKSRWFALKPDKLTYYVSSGYREKKGDVILNNEAKVTSIPDKGSNKYRFQVLCGSTKKDYEQTAPDQRTKQAWMTDIQTAIGRLNKQKFLALHFVFLHLCICTNILSSGYGIVNVCFLVSTTILVFIISKIISAQGCKIVKFGSINYA